MIWISNMSLQLTFSLEKPRNVERFQVSLMIYSSNMSLQLTFSLEKLRNVERFQVSLMIWISNISLQLTFSLENPATSKDFKFLWWFTHRTWVCNWHFDLKTPQRRKISSFFDDLDIEHQSAIDIFTCQPRNVEIFQVSLMFYSSNMSLQLTFSLENPATSKDFKFLWWFGYRTSVCNWHFHVKIPQRRMISIFFDDLHIEHESAIDIFTWKTRNVERFQVSLMLYSSNISLQLTFRPEKPATSKDFKFLWWFTHPTSVCNWHFHVKNT